MELSAEARTLHDVSTIIDGLQISNWIETVFRSNHQGGVTAVTATVAVHEGFRQTIKNIARWQEMFRKYAGFMMPIKSANDIVLAKKVGKTGFIFGFQDTAPIEEDLDLISIFHALGVRVIQLTYMKANCIGQGCLERFDSGLTDFGIEVIEEMNRLGILIDLSHVGYRTAMAAIEVSQKPMAFTHANPRSLWDHPRNKTDEEIRGVAERGGVIGATIFPAFLPSGNRATIDDYIDVIDYLVEMVGIDHVAVGTDFTEAQPKEFFDWLLTGNSKRGPCMELVHPVSNPKGIQSAKEFPSITQSLMKRRYADGEIKKIMGENWLRLYREVWNEQG